MDPWPMSTLPRDISEAGRVFLAGLPQVTIGFNRGFKMGVSINGGTPKTLDRLCHEPSENNMDDFGAICFNGDFEYWTKYINTQHMLPIYLKHFNICQYVSPKMLQGL